MDKVSTRILRALDNLGIDLIFTKMDRRGFYWPDQKSIVMNEAFLYSNDINFNIAHELSHVINEHNELRALYDSSFSSRSKMEHEANLGAIKLLIDIYLDETGMDYEQLNSSKFMEYYGIENRLFDAINETMIKYRYAQ